MSRRNRILGFGSAGVLVVAGILCAALVSGGLGQNLAFVLVALGLVDATSLVFYEVGLTEDHDRDRERKRLARASGGGALPPDRSSTATPQRVSTAPEHPSTAPEHPSTAPEHPSTAPEHPSTAPEHASTAPEHSGRAARSNRRRIERLRGHPRRLC